MKMEKKWYDGIFQDDNSLIRALDLLETLRGVLPPEKEIALDQAKALLIQASKVYCSNNNTISSHFEKA